MTMSNGAGNYEFRSIEDGKYDVVVRFQRKEVRQRVQISCGPHGAAVVDIVLDKRATPRLTVHFPVDDPDIADVSELTRNYPKEAVRNYDKARDDLRAGDLVRAAERLRATLGRAPEFYSARARLGMVYQTMGCYAEAAREYTMARDLNPRSVQALVNLGSLYVQAAGASDAVERPLEMAIGILNEAIQRKPTSAIAYCLLGAAHFKASSYDEAEENFKHALRIQSRMTAARLMLANLYMHLEKWEGALEHLDAYLKENPFAEDHDQVRRIREEVAENFNR